MRAMPRPRQAGTDRPQPSPARWTGRFPVPRCPPSDWRIRQVATMPRFLGPETQKSRRRPIFPKGCPLSIFGAGELDFRVRDGNGYGLSASVTRILLLDVIGCVRARDARLRFERGRREVRSTISSLSKNSRLIRFDQSSDPWSEAEVVKPSTISTAQLHSSPNFHMRPIKQVVYLRSYPISRWGTSSPGELRT